MAFPATTLPLLTELYINGIWTDATADVRVANGGGVTITRGRADESSRVSPSQANLVLDNRSGNYSNRNPSSPYYGLLGRGTQLRHRIRWIQAAFASTVSSAWPTADTGQTWTNSGGAASDYSTSGGFGLHTHTSVNVFRSSVIETSATDMDITVGAKLDITTATGAAAGHWIAVRYTDSSNYYAARLLLTTGGAVTLDLGKRVGGTFSDIGGSTITEDASHTGGDWWTVRVSVRGSRVRAMAWPQGTTPPTSWQLSATDTALTAGTKAALLSRLETGNTNTLNVVFSWDNFEYNDFRFWGETAASAPQWDKSGNDVTVPIEAAGILRRLSDSKRPLDSPLYRAMIGVNSGDFVPVAYWPMQDGSGATQLASAIAGVPPASIVGTVTPANYSGIPGSLPVPTLDDGSIKGSFPAYTFNNVWETQFTMMIPSTASGSGSGQILYSILLKTGNTVREFRVTLKPGLDLFVEAFDPSGTQLVNATITAATYLRDTPYLAAMIDFVSGGTRHVQFLLRQAGNTAVDAFTDFGPDGPGAGTPGVVATWYTRGQSGTSGGWSFAHHALFTDANLYGSSVIAPNAQAAGGYAGETAADRMTRLCREAGIPFELIGTAADTQLMGPQQVKTLVDLLFDCADTDLGILFEPRDAFSLVYRTRLNLYNQTAAATLNYPAGVIGGNFQPVADDQIVTNDVTVKRIGGSSARYQVTSGPLSIQDPPNGVGTVDTAPELNLYADTQCQPLAEWIGNLSTWDEDRYPTLTVQMANSNVVADTALSAGLAALDLGDAVAVTNPPSWQPPEDIGLMVEGSQEFLSLYDWTLTFNTVPSGPYTVGVYDSSRYDSNATTLNGSLTTTATTVNYTVAAGEATWATTAANAAQFPFDLLDAGERMSVTSATATTFTVTRSVNGVVKAHSSGEPVHVYQPGRYAL